MSANAFACRGCPAAFQTIIERDKHRREDHPTRYRLHQGRCIACRKGCIDLWSFLDHFSTAHEQQYNSIILRASHRLGVNLVENAELFYLMFIPIDAEEAPTSASTRMDSLFEQAVSQMETELAIAAAAAEEDTDSDIEFLGIVQGTPRTARAVMRNEARMRQADDTVKNEAQNPEESNVPGTINVPETLVEPTTPSTTAPQTSGDGAEHVVESASSRQPTSRAGPSELGAQLKAGNTIENIHRSISGGGETSAQKRPSLQLYHPHAPPCKRPAPLDLEAMLGETSNPTNTTPATPAVSAAATAAVEMIAEPEDSQDGMFLPPPPAASSDDPVVEDPAAETNPTVPTAAAHSAADPTVADPPPDAPTAVRAAAAPTAATISVTGLPTATTTPAEPPGAATASQPKENLVREQVQKIRDNVNALGVLVGMQPPLPQQQPQHSGGDAAVKSTSSGAAGGDGLPDQHPAASPTLQQAQQNAVAAAAFAVAAVAAAATAANEAAALDPPLALDAPPCLRDTEYCAGRGPPQCPRGCRHREGRADSKQNRILHYKSCHYDAYFGDLLRRFRTDFAQFMEQNLGEARAGPPRACLHCAGDRRLRPNHRSRVELARHVEEDHPEEFRTLVEAYAAFNRMDECVELHVILTPRPQ